MIIGAIGRRHQGKTTLGYSMARKCESRVILDVRATVPNPDPVFDLPHDREKLSRQMSDPEWPEIVVRPGDGFETTNEYLAQTMKNLMRDPDGRIAIMFDEAGLIDFRPWDAYFRTAHPDKVVLIITAHRLQDIPPKVRALMDWFCMFRTTEPNDLKLAGEQCGNQVADILPRLGPRIFVRYDAGATDDEKQVMIFSDPKAWYVPMNTPAFAGTRADLVTGGDSTQTIKRGLF